MGSILFHNILYRLVFSGIREASDLAKFQSTVELVLLVNINTIHNYKMFISYGAQACFHSCKGFLPRLIVTHSHAVIVAENGF